MAINSGLVLSFRLLIGCALLLSLTPCVAQNKPNIVMIFTDDMGYGDISSFSNALAVETPNIDRLATGGMKFTQFYVSMPICSPSRAAVLSGMYAPETRVTNYLQERQGNKDSDGNDWMDPKQSYLLKTFQAAGYATGHMGKWHLGGGRDVDNAPSIGEYGYDEFYSTWESPNPDPRLGVEFPPWSTQLEPGQVPRHQRTQYMVDKTLDFMQRHANQPCFVTLWPDDLHTPFRPSPAMITKYGADPNGADTIKQFYGVLDEYDRQIGRLLDGLAAQGMEENTIIFFTGDNGPSPTYSNHLRTDGLRGRKLSLYEGGIREPFIIRWPGHIPAGATNSATVLSSVDLLPTLASLAGIELSAAVASQTDGEDLSQAMLGTPITRSNPLLWEYGATASVPRPGGGNINDRSPVLAIREGDFKLFVEANNTGHQLYNVRTDPREITNLASAQPGRVQSMAAQVIAWSTTLPHRTHDFPAFGLVNFNQFSVAEVATEAALRTASGAADTNRIDGVTGHPNGSGDLFAIHIDGTEKETILRIDDGEGELTKVTDAPRIAQDLGALPSSGLQLTSGFDYSPPGNKLYIAEKSLVSVPGQVLLIGIDTATGQANLVTRSSDLEGLNDHAVLPYGDLIGVSGEDGNRTVGTIDFRSGQWTQKLSHAQLLAAAPGSSSLPPQSAGINSSSGKAFMFSGGDLDLFDIANVNSASPTVSRIIKSQLANADLRDIAVDQAGNMFGLDVTDGRIIIMRGSDQAMFSVSLAEIATSLGRTEPFVPTQWRGMTARMTGATRCELFLASSNSNYGLVRIKFGPPSAAVGDWTLYGPSFDD